MILENYLLIIVKQQLVYQIFMMVKIYLNNGWNYCLIVKVEFYSLYKNILILFRNLENSLLCEYIDCINNDLLLSSNDEIENLYTSVFRHIYKAIQSLDYFSSELIAYIGTLTYLAKWSTLVRVCVLLKKTVRYFI
jgi:hypothetical protein